MKNKLPNFLIVGAAKSGTSSLHNYLNQHKEVFMPSYNEEGMKVKEPRFLIKNAVENRLHNGVWSWEEYQNLFKGVTGEKVVGESSVLYLYYYELAIENIKKYLGKEIKIIIMLRNPTDRAYSAFQHVSRGFQEQNSFEESLLIEEGRLDRNPDLTPMVMYQEMGMYFKMVKSFQNNFKNIHIIFYDDFRDNTEKEMKKTFQFLGLSLSTDIDFFTRHNVGGKRWKNDKMKHFFMKNNPIKSLFKKVFSSSFRIKIRNNMVSVSTNRVVPMNVETRVKLNNTFKEDVEKLSELLNRDLTKWTNNGKT